METTRQQKIARLIQKDLGVYFQQNSILFGGSLVTVTKVYITSDLSVARVYLSLFATSDKNALLEKIRKHAREIRRHMGTRERHQLRVIPEIHFFVDDSLDYIDNLDNLLKS